MARANQETPNKMAVHRQSETGRLLVVWCLLPAQCTEYLSGDESGGKQIDTLAADQRTNDSVRVNGPALKSRETFGIRGTLKRAARTDVSVT